MRTIAFTIAVAGLVSLAGCGRSPQAAAVADNAEMLADDLERQARDLEQLADNTANRAAAESIENATDALADDASNVREAGEDAAGNLD